MSPGTTNGANQKMKLGFLVDNLGASQLGYYLSQNINDALERYDDLDIICYYENFEGKCMHQNFSNINISGAWSQEGVMIATSPSRQKRWRISLEGARNIFMFGTTTMTKLITIWVVYILTRI